MKTRIIITIMLLITFSAIGRLIEPFPGWTELENRSPYIIIVDCKRQFLRSGTVINGPNSDYTIDVKAFLKGTNNVSSGRLWTDHNLKAGQEYLVFGYYDSDIYEAYEDYRVVPLGINFPLDSVRGKALDEQLRISFQSAVDELNRQIKEEEAEKNRLEEALQK
jgi:hypothetical protein